MRCPRLTSREIPYLWFDYLHPIIDTHDLHVQTVIYCSSDLIIYMPWDAHDLQAVRYHSSDFIIYMPWDNHDLQVVRYRSSDLIIYMPWDTIVLIWSFTCHWDAHDLQVVRYRSSDLIIYMPWDTIVLIWSFTCLEIPTIYKSWVKVVFIWLITHVSQCSPGRSNLWRHLVEYRMTFGRTRQVLLDSASPSQTHRAQPRALKSLVGTTHVYKPMVYVKTRELNCNLKSQNPQQINKYLRHSEYPSIAYFDTT